jgi:cullin 1
VFFFSSKKLRINLNVPLKSVEQKDIEGVHRTIDEDRKMVIQAAIVRIMKARQTLKHALLMQEVIQQLSSRFRPKIPVIKVKKKFHANKINLFVFLFLEMY